MARDADCIFCKIAAGALPAAKVLHNDHAVALLDIAPAAPGHLLVLPPDHYATLDTMPGDRLAALAAELPRLVRAVLRATGAPALHVIQNNGRAAGQTVDHVHFHLVPRTAGDRFHIDWNRGPSAAAALAELRDRIAAELELPTGVS
jgi:histidine triad (HIT) family protein